LTDLVLVTGATGFVGTALCRALLDSGFNVRALHRASSTLKNLAGLPVEYFQGDILDLASMRAACVGTRWVFHAASQSDYWRNPDAVKRSAIEGTSNIANAALAAGVEKFVFTSSLSAMGIPVDDELLTESHTFNLPEEKFPYGAAKRQAELALLGFVEKGLDAVIVNPALILGPGDLNRITGSMVVEAARGWGFFYLDGGANYIHIEDVARGHLAAARLGEHGKRYILGGENISHQEAFTVLTQVVGRRPPWLKIPNWVVPPAAWLIDRLSGLIKLPFDANQLRISRRYIYCDIEPAQRKLQLDAPISFRQAVEDTYKWYLREGVIE
jgi:dihydroflavonol-4-reductase